MKEFRRVDKKAKIKWFLGRLIGLVLLAGVVLPVLLVFDIGIWGIIIGASLLLLQLSNTIIYPLFEYIQWSYYIGEDCIEIKKGVFWRSHIVIPISRIQHVTARSGPVQRLFKLATVEIHTASGEHTIEELSSSVADEICQSLQNMVNKKAAAQLAAAEAAETAE